MAGWDQMTDEFRGKRVNERVRVRVRAVLPEAAVRGANGRGGESGEVCVAQLPMVGYRVMTGRDAATGD